MYHPLLFKISYYLIRLILKYANRISAAPTMKAKSAGLEYVFAVPAGVRVSKLSSRIAKLVAAKNNPTRNSMSRLVNFITPFQNYQKCSYEKQHSSKRGRDRKDQILSEVSKYCDI